MEQLLVLSNPRRRRRKSKSRARRRVRKMSALQRKYFGGGRVHSNPKRRRRARRARSSVPTFRRYARRARRGARRLGFTPSAATSVLKPALVGAVGAVGTNFVLSQLASRGIIPATLMTGKTRFLTQGALAIGLGMLASRLSFVGSGTASKMAEGALTVTLANAITEVANENGLALSGMGYYLPGFNPGRAVPNAGGSAAMMAGMGKYVTGPGAGMAGLSNVRPFRRGMRGAGNINTFAF